MLTLFWFRRDLRWHDNAGLFWALKENKNILPLFIFDSDILKNLAADDLRVPFLHQTLMSLKLQINLKGSDILIKYGSPLDVFKDIYVKYKIKSIYTNHDYEPLACRRDDKISTWANEKGIEFKTYKDHVIFEKNEIQTALGRPYTVYTPYKKKWLASLSQFYLKSYPIDLYTTNFHKIKLSEPIPSLKEMNFSGSSQDYPEIAVSAKILKSYEKNRDFPALDQTSKLGLHLRFGTVSVRELAREGQKYSAVWLSELIWRDFFMQILFHYPESAEKSFKPQYENINWRNNSNDFDRWKSGQTGYLLVDAGMRELNATGHMHNRVRMVVASFLTKHLLIHWHKGERYFASKLLDYDLAANCGNWQWAAGTGCDAAPYFRIFNPTTQLEKFDPDLEYVKKWVPEYGTNKYPAKMVEHVFARNRALTEYKKGLIK